MKATCGAALAALFLAVAAEAGTLSVRLGGGRTVSFVGAVCRFDEDGNPRKPVNKDAKIDKPEVDAVAETSATNTWQFKNLPPGAYDLVLLAGERTRIEGFSFAPVLEFDPVMPPDADPGEEAREFVEKHIRQSPHYENKVEPLYLAGDKRACRILVQLIRDLPTSYTPGAGTMRHEIWQYTFNYGGWQKEKRTQVLDRHILQVSELKRWTWVWDPKLGGIAVKQKPVTFEYDLPATLDPEKLKGLYPY